MNKAIDSGTAKLASGLVDDNSEKQSESFLMRRMFHGFANWVYEICTYLLSIPVIHTCYATIHTCYTYLLCL